MVAGESAREVARRSREKAERLNRFADAYDKGAAGEEATARALTALPSARWSVLHDVRWPGRRLANIDHVVIGPGGVFVIDSKAWSGDVVVDNGVLRQNGYQRERAVASAADAALAVADAVWGLDANLTHPVLCFVGDQQVEGWAREVMLCTPSNLVRMLTTRPEVLDAATVRRTLMHVQAALTSAQRSAATWTSTSQHRSPAARSTARSPASPRSTPLPPVRDRGVRTRRVVLALLALILLPVFATPLAVLVTGVSRSLAGAITSHPSGADPGSNSAEGSARAKVGTTVALPPATNRPPLKVTVASVRTVHRVGRLPYLFDGNRFFGVKLVIHNAGKRNWSSEPGTTLQAITALGVSHRAGGAIRIREGHMLADPLRIRPGGTVRGYVVAQVPANDPVTAVTLTVGPGQPRTVTWSVDRQ